MTNYGFHAGQQERRGHDRIIDSEKWKGCYVQGLVKEQRVGR